MIGSTGKIYNMYQLVTLFVLFLLFELPCYGAVLFETNFNKNADWQPRPADIVNDKATSGGVVTCDYHTPSCLAAPPPSGWDYYRVTGWWWGPMYQDGLRITNQADHGGTGKSFIVYNEANNGASGDGWGADGILLKLLPTDQNELYVRFWLKTGDMHWADSRNNIKLFRTSHFDRTNTTLFQGFSAGPRAPIYIYDLAYSTTYGVEQTHAFRCDPQGSDYYCPNSPAGDGDRSSHFTIGGVSKKMPETPEDIGVWGDGNWHKHDFHIKMNTYIGNGSWSSDGVLEFWFDGVLQKSINNIKWINSGTDASIGWNTIEFGGNAYNSFTDTFILLNHNYIVGDRVNYSGYVWECIQNNTSSNSVKPSFSSEVYWRKIGIISDQKIEQWYAIDDVVISTTPIPTNYVIGGALTSPQNPSGGWTTIPK